MGIGAQFKGILGSAALVLAPPLVVLGTPSKAAAQAQVEFDIPAGRLSNSIRVLARQATISVATTDSRIRSIHARGVKGRISPREALNRLLQGTPYRAVALPGGNFRIERRPPQRARPPAVAATIPAALPPPPPPPRPIIVEASKTAVSPNEYPGGIKVLALGDPAGEAIGEGLDQALESLPSVNGTALGPGRNKIFLRGIADSSFNGPTQSTIGLYLGEQRLIFSAPNPDLRLYDVGNVELLEGPQGTLYGAGTLAGLLRINPNTPDPSGVEATAWAGAGYVEGGAASWELGAMLNLPISDDSALRAVGYSGEEAGFIADPSRRIDNINSSRFFGGRAALGFKIGPDWEVEFSGFGQKSELDDGQYADASLPGLSRTDLLAQPFATDIYGGSVMVRGYLGPTELVSTAGIINHNLQTTFDSSVLTGDPARQAFRESRAIEMISHETRLSSTGSGSIDWLLGVAALRNRDAMRQVFTNLSGNSPPPFANLTYRLDEIAAFGEATIKLAPTWSLTSGARVLYTNASGERSFGPTTIVEPREGPARFLPAVALAWRPDDSWTAYARFQEGFRTGGVTIERDQNRDPETAQFDPDRVMSYEAGLRGKLGGQNPLELALTVHHSDWKDIQADLVDAQGFPITRNIGNGTIFGIDASAQWRSSNQWSLTLSGAFNDTNVDRLLPNGATTRAPIPNVPEISLQGRVSKVWEIGQAARFGLAAQGRYVGRSFLDIDQQVRVEQGDFATFDAATWWSRGAIEVRFQALNITGNAGNRFAFGNPFTVRLENQFTPVRPRTVRIQISITR